MRALLCSPSLMAHPSCCASMLPPWAPRQRPWWATTRLWGWLRAQLVRKVSGRQPGPGSVCRELVCRTATSIESLDRPGTSVGTTAAGDKLRLVVVSVSSGEVLQEEDFPAAALNRAAHGAALQPGLVALGAFRKKDKSWGVRSAGSSARPCQSRGNVAHIGHQRRRMLDC